MNSETTQRIDVRFFKELKDISNKRKELGKEKKKISVKTLTALIPKHKYWNVIKREMIGIENETIKNVLVGKNGEKKPKFNQE